MILHPFKSFDQTRELAESCTRPWCAVPIAELPEPIVSSAFSSRTEHWRCLIHDSNRSNISSRRGLRSVPINGVGCEKFSLYDRNDHLSEVHENGHGNLHCHQGLRAVP